MIVVGEVVVAPGLCASEISVNHHLLYCTSTTAASMRQCQFVAQYLLRQHVDIVLSVLALYCMLNLGQCSSVRALS